MSGSDILLSVVNDIARIFTNYTSPGNEIVFDNSHGPGDLTLQFQSKELFGFKKIKVAQNEKRTLEVKADAFGDYTFEANVKDGRKLEQVGIVAVAQSRSGGTKCFEITPDGMLTLICPFKELSRFNFVVNPPGRVWVSFPDTGSEYAPLVNVATRERLKSEFEVVDSLEVEVVALNQRNLFTVSTGKPSKELQTGGEEQGDIFILPP